MTKPDYERRRESTTSLCPEWGGIAASVGARLPPTGLRNDWAGRYFQTGLPR
jgi:hypothetical protein